MNRNILPALLFLLSIVLITGLVSCAGLETGRNIIPVKLQVSDNLVLPFKPAKCLYDQRSETYYIMEQNRSYIYLYRKAKQINQIGGLGLDKSSFQKLSDIAIDADGYLMALDEFGKVIRKYDSEGKWIADIDIYGFNQPSKLCITQENDIIIYDNAAKELQRISSFNGKTMFSFGRFQVDSVSGITAGKDMVAVVDNSQSKTVLFTGMGLFLKEIPDQMVLDQHQNQYCYVDGAVKLTGTDLLVPIGKANSDIRLCANAGNIFVIMADKIVTIQTLYSGN